MVHILWSHAIYTWRGIAFCPVCKGRRRCVYADSGYYGLDCTCCGCGDRWSDGELCPRPFERGWREKAAAKARAQWAKLTAKHWPTHLRALKRATRR